MPYYLGIDGGGTKTTCVIGDESQTLAVATAGPSNIVRVGEKRACESLHEGVRQACEAAKITPQQIACTVAGESGATRPEIRAIALRILSEVLPMPAHVVGDMEIAVEAAFDTSPGVIVIAGTGSIAYGRDCLGNTARAGGWGFAIGDEGSAHWIGRQAVTAVLRASDCEAVNPNRHAAFTNSTLVGSLLRAWSADSLDDLAGKANMLPPPDFAQLFPVLANSKDEIARKVLMNAGQELARIAALMTRRLFPTNESQSVPVAMIGGVFRHASVVREIFYNELRTLDARVQVNPQVVEPVEGALRMARRAAEKAIIG